MTDNQKLIEEAFKKHDAPAWDEDAGSRDAAIRWHIRGFNDALAVFEAAHTPTDDERARIEQSNNVASIVFDQIKKVWPDLHPVLDLRYGIADALWAAGFRRSEVSKPGEHDGSIPLYGMLDVWTALYGTSHPEFDTFYAEHGYAETWARILAAVRERREVPEPSAEGYAEFEDWEQEMFRHQPVLSMADGSIAGCQCLDRVFVKGEDWGTHLATIITSRITAEPQGEPSDAQVEAAGALLYGISWGTDIADPDLVRDALRAAGVVGQGGEQR